MKEWNNNLPSNNGNTKPVLNPLKMDFEIRANNHYQPQQTRHLARIMARTFDLLVDFVANEKHRLAECDNNDEISIQSHFISQILNRHRNIM